MIYFDTSNPSDDDLGFKTQEDVQDYIESIEEGM